MQQQHASTKTARALAPEDALRADVYRLLARFLSSPPGPTELAAAARLEGDDTPFGRAISTFAHVAARSDAGAVTEEYSDLFIGLGRGEVIPYGSYYLSGFLHEKPLAKLRQEMDRLGLARVEGVKEPEDHAASILEIMAGLIDGMPGPQASLMQQKEFFVGHVDSWMAVFFKDVATAKSSRLYATLAEVGRIFLEIESEGFRMVSE